MWFVVQKKIIICFLYKYKIAYKKYKEKIKKIFITF